MLSESALILLSFFISFCLATKEQIPQPHDPKSPVRYPPDFCEKLTGKESFDYIVIGSGPSGATVGRRLAENPEWKVLILEAGEDPPLIYDIPGNKPIPPDESALWNISPEKSPTTCLGFPNETCAYFQAKMLGGCSNINGMIYVRGNHEDYDEWERAGCPGWGWKNMLPYFNKMENFVTNRTYDPKYHSTGGPFTSSYLPLDPQSYPYVEKLKEALKSNQIPHNPDVNGKTQIGYGEIPGMNEVTGYRNNIAKSYLLNIPDNLKVCKHALVTKLIILAKSDPKEVTGVEFIYKGSEKKTLKARREYIVAGSGLNTPQILERSGIGRKEVLKKAGVKLIHELKGVGENLQEQYSNLGCFFTSKYVNQVPTNPQSISFANFLVFLNFTDFSARTPDLQLSLALVTGLGAKPAIEKQIQKEMKTSTVIIGLSTILRQTTPGSIHITQTDPLQRPFFNPNQYSSQTELKLQAKGCRFLRINMRNPVFEKFGIKPLVLDQCKKYPFNSDEEIICAVKLLPYPLYHLGGTAKMGPRSDPMTVVDPSMRVHGIRGLRVTDLSVIPKIPRGNSEIPTIAIAERAADLIKKEGSRWSSRAI